MVEATAVNEFDAPKCVLQQHRTKQQQRDKTTGGLRTGLTYDGEPAEATIITEHGK